MFYCVCISFEQAAAQMDVHARTDVQTFARVTDMRKKGTRNEMNEPISEWMQDCENREAMEQSAAYAKGNNQHATTKEEKILTRKNLFSKIVAGVLAAGMVVTMLPGLSMTAKAAPVITLTQVLPLEDPTDATTDIKMTKMTSIIKQYPTNESLLADPLSLPPVQIVTDAGVAWTGTDLVADDYGGTGKTASTWDIGTRGNVKFVLIPGDYWEFDDPEPTVTISPDSGDPWNTGYTGGNNQIVYPNTKDPSGRSYIIEITDSDEALKAGTLRLTPPEAKLLEVSITVNANGVVASQESERPKDDNGVTFDTKTWKISYNPESERYLVNGVNFISQQGKKHNAVTDYSSEIVVFARKGSSSASDFVVTVGSGHNDTEAQENQVSYNTEDAILVDQLKDTGYDESEENLEGSTVAKAGFTNKAPATGTDTTSYIGVYKLNNDGQAETATRSWLNDKTFKNADKTDFPDEITQNIYLTINPEDIYRLYVFGVAKDNDGTVAHSEALADMGTTNRKQANSLRYNGYKNTIINFGSGAPKKAKIKIQNGDELTYPGVADPISVANIYTYSYVIRDKDGKRFDATEELQHTYNYLTGDPAEYPYLPESHDTAERWWQEGETYMTNYKEGEVFEFTVKVDPIYDDTNMIVQAYGHDDYKDPATDYSSYTYTTIKKDETTGTYKFTIGKDSPYRIVVRGLTKKATGIVRNIPQDDAIFDTGTAHDETLTWANTFYGTAGKFPSYGGNTDCNVTNPRYQLFMPAHEEDSVFYDLLAFATPGAVGSATEWNGHEFPVGEYQFKLRFSNAFLPEHGVFNDTATDDRYAFGADGKVTLTVDGTTTTLTANDEGIYSFKVEEDKTYDIRVDGIIPAYKVRAANTSAYNFVDVSHEMNREASGNFESSVPEGETYSFKLDFKNGVEPGPNFKVMLVHTGDQWDHDMDDDGTVISADDNGVYSFDVFNDTEIVIYGLGNTGFSDLAGRSDEEQAAIQWLLDQKVVEGYDDGSFRPGNNLTRAEFVKMLWAFNGSPEASAANYSDTSNHWAASPIGWGTTEGIVNGYPDGTFKPDRSISRAEVAQVIWKLAGNSAISGMTASFTDVLRGQWYTPAVDWNFEKGVVKGYGNGLFGTNDPIERAHMALVLYRSRDMLKK